MSDLRCTCGAIDFTLCQCSVDSSESIDIKGSGNLNPLHPYTTLDPDDDNLMTEDPALLTKLPSYVISPPRCSAYNNAALPIATDQGVVVTLNSEYFDLPNNDMHDTVTNNSRITIVEPGIYRVKFVCAFAGNVTGDRAANIRKNGYDFIAGDEKKALVSASLETGLNVATQEWFEEGEFIEAIVKQDSGISINLNATRYSPILTAVFRRRPPSG